MWRRYISARGQFISFTAGHNVARSFDLRRHLNISNYTDGEKGTPRNLVEVLIHLRAITTSWWLERVTKRGRQK